MSYSNKIIQFSAKVFLLSLGLTLIACGGGGGGGSGSNGVPASSITYSGNTNPANISAAEAEEIAASFDSSSQQNSSAIAQTITITNQKLDESSKNELIEKLKQDAIDAVNQSQNNGLVTGAAGDVIRAGTCNTNDATLSDGSSISRTTNFSNTEVNVKITYTNLCLYNTVNGGHLILNGDVYSSIKGNDFLTAGAAVITSITLDIPELTVKHTDSLGNIITATVSEQYKFVFEYDTNGVISKVTFSAFKNISVNGIVFRFEVEFITIGNNAPSITLKFYHPVHGVITYVSTLAFTCSNGRAESGSLVITGANGSYTITPTGACDGSFNAVLN